LSFKNVHFLHLMINKNMKLSGYLKNIILKH